MIHLELSKLLSPVTGATGVTVEGKAAVETNDPDEGALPSFRQLLQAGGARLAMAEVVVGGTSQSPRVEFLAGEPSERATTDAGPVAIPRSTDGTLPRSDAAELADEEGEAVVDIHQDEEGADEEWIEAIWPGLPWYIASRAALRSADSPKGEPSPSAVVIAVPEARPVSLAFGSVTPFAKGMKSAESAHGAVRSPMPESATSVLEIRIDSDPRVSLVAGGEPAVVAETEETDSSFGSLSLAARDLEAPATVRTPHPNPPPQGGRESAGSPPALKEPPAPAAPRMVAEMERLAPPPNPDSSPFATIQSGRQPAITEAVMVVEGSQSESVSGNSAIGHAVELDAATAGRATIGPASPAPTTPARPDAGIPPTPLPIIPEPLNLLQKNWGWMLGRQLHWMINNRTHEAKISVNPPHLGPLEVRVSVHQNQTSVTFFSHEAAVREALETAMPRLRELLDGQGLHLNQAQVSDPSLARQQTGWGEQAPRQRDGGSAAENRNQETAADNADDQSPPPRRPRGMVDDYV